MKRVSFIIFFLTLLVLVGFVGAQDEPTVYVTKTGSKYHKAGCSYIKKSGVPKKLSEIEGRYAPCSRCNPPKMTQKTITKDKPINDGKNETYTDEDLSAYTSKQSKKAADSTSTNDEIYSSKKSSDKTIYTGPRGGRYYYSPSGKKVYIKKK